jgi:hypothetical protein
LIPDLKGLRCEDIRQDPGSEELEDAALNREVWLKLLKEARLDIA